MKLELKPLGSFVFVRKIEFEPLQVLFADIDGPKWLS